MGNPFAFLLLSAKEQMTGLIELFIDPALEVAEASADKQLWQDLPQGLASRRQALLKLIAIDEFADRQVQSLEFGLILLVEPGNGDMNWIELLSELDSFLGVLVVRQNLSVFEILEDQIGDLVPELTVPIQEGLNTVG